MSQTMDEKYKSIKSKQTGYKTPKAVDNAPLEQDAMLLNSKIQLQTKGACQGSCSKYDARWQEQKKYSQAIRQKLEKCKDDLEQQSELVNHLRKRVEKLEKLVYWRLSGQTSKRSSSDGSTSQSENYEHQYSSRSIDERARRSKDELNGYHLTPRQSGVYRQSHQRRIDAYGCREYVDDAYDEPDEIEYQNSCRFPSGYVYHSQHMTIHGGQNEQYSSWEGHPSNLERTYFYFPSHPTARDLHSRLRRRSLQETCNSN